MEVAKNGGKTGLRKTAGFTLLELLVAFAIMAMSLGMLYRASGGGARSVGEIENYQRAVLLAESVLALRDVVPQGGWNETGESAGFAWRVSSVPFGDPSRAPGLVKLQEVRIAVSWNESARPKVFELNTLLPQSVQSDDNVGR